MWPVHDAEDGVEQDEQGELSVQQFVNASLPAQQQLVETEEGGVGYFTGISDSHPETTWETDRGTGGLTSWIINTSEYKWSELLATHIKALRFFLAFHQASSFLFVSVKRQLTTAPCADTLSLSLHHDAAQFPSNARQPIVCTASAPSYTEELNVVSAACLLA